MKRTLSSCLCAVALVVFLVTPASALLLKTYDFETPALTSTPSFGSIDEGWQAAINPGGIWKPIVGGSATDPDFDYLPSGVQVAYTYNGSLWIDTGVVLGIGSYMVSAFVGNSANDDFADDFFFRAAYQSGSGYLDIVRYDYTDAGSPPVPEGGWLQIGYGFDVDALNPWYGKKLVLGFNASASTVEDAITGFDHVTIERIAVPDSSIFMLLGPSLVGLGIFGRRKFFKK